MYTATDVGRPIEIKDTKGKPIFVGWIKMRRTIPIDSSFTTARLLVEAP